MAKNGNTLASAATTKARTPDELYDSLGEPGQALWDQIVALGFRPEKDEHGNWWGLSINGDDKLGPFESLSVLTQEVTRHTALPEPLTEPPGVDEPEPEKQGGNVVKIKQNSTGQQYLEGQEPELDSELASVSGEYQALKIDRVNLQKKESVAKENLEQVVKRKKHLFKTDPDNTNDRIYEITPEFRIRIGKEFTETITTETGLLGTKKKGKKAA